MSTNDQSILGGFSGKNETIGTIVDSYWLRELPVRYAGVGEGPADGVKGVSVEQMQSSTDYTGIYANWLIDLDNADGDFDETTGMDGFLGLWNFQ